MTQPEHHCIASTNTTQGVPVPLVAPKRRSLSDGDVTSGDESVWVGEGDIAALYIVIRFCWRAFLY